MIFGAADAATKHRAQHFELLGSRAIDHDRWRAVCSWPGSIFIEAAQEGRRFGDTISSDTRLELDATGWELYQPAEDPTESTNVNLVGRAPPCRICALPALHLIPPIAPRSLAH